jgi:hypothetical protein
VVPILPKTVPSYFSFGDRYLSVLHARLRNTCCSLNSDLFKSKLVPRASCSCGYKTRMFRALKNIYIHVVQVHNVDNCQNAIHVDLLVQEKRREVSRLAIYYTLAHSMCHRPLKFAFFVLLYVFFLFVFIF